MLIIPKTLIFPILIISLDIGAALFYFIGGDIRRGIYWAAAAVLTTCVTIK
jgi:hypothetical protein